MQDLKRQIVYFWAKPYAPFALIIAVAATLRLLGFGVRADTNPHSETVFIGVVLVLIIAVVIERLVRQGAFRKR